MDCLKSHLFFLNAFCDFLYPKETWVRSSQGLEFSEQDGTLTFLGDLAGEHGVALAGATVHFSLVEHPLPSSLNKLQKCQVTPVQICHLEHMN